MLQALAILQKKREGRVSGEVNNKVLWVELRLEKYARCRHRTTGCQSCRRQQPLCPWRVPFHGSCRPCLPAACSRQQLRFARRCAIRTICIFGRARAPSTSNRRHRQPWSLDGRVSVTSHHGVAGRVHRSTTWVAIGHCRKSDG